MAYQKFNLEEQMWRLSQGKPTCTPVEVLASLVASRMAAQRKANALPKSDANAFLTSLFALPDTRTSRDTRGQA